MQRKTKKLVVVALLVTAAAAAIALLFLNAPFLHHPHAPSAPVTRPVVVEDVPPVAVEPARLVMPLVPPDPVLTGSGKIVVMGRVVDHETGLPVAGASIERQALPISATSALVTTHTDELGEFELETPLREMAKVRVSASQYATVELDPQEFVHPHDHMTAGEVFRLGDIHLGRGVQPVVRVLDADSKPIAGAKIVMCEASLFTGRSHSRTLGVSDADGEWTATEPLSGVGQHADVMAVSGNTCGFTSLALQRDGSRGERLDVVLQPAVEIVAEAQAIGPVSRPLAGVTIHIGIYPSAVVGLWRGLSHPNPSDTDWLHAKTDARGVARMWLPRVDRFHDAVSLTATLEGFETVRCDVRPDTIREPVKLRMQPSSDPKFAHAADGTVLNAAGHPVPGAVVRCGELTSVPDPTTGGFHLDLGNMRFDRALALTAEAPGYALRRVQATARQDPIAAAFVLDPLTCLRGRVVDEQGRGMAGVPVQIEHAPTDATAHTRADGTFCLVFPWRSTLVVDELSVKAGWLRDADAAYESTIVPIGDPEHVDIVLKAKSLALGTVSARVVDDESSQPAPVVRMILMTRSGWTFSGFTQDEVVTGIGSFRATHLRPGTWDVAIESSDGRVGSGTFEIGADHLAASTEVRVGPVRSLVVRVVPEEARSPEAADASYVVTAEPALSYPRMNLLVAMSDPIASTRRARAGADGTFTFDRMEPGSWKIVAEGARGRSERIVVVTTRADVQTTMYAKPRSESASLQLTNLDSRFDGPVYVRLEREHEDPLEFVADPMNGRAQTFSVSAGESHLVVYPMHDDVPDVDAQPIARLKLDIAAGATEVVALYPR